jgi:hypothetical protein
MGTGAGAMMNELGAIVWGVSGRWPWMCVAGLALACIALSILIYVRQARAVPRFWWIVMLILRMAALVAICLSMLQPTAVRLVNPDAGGVAILIDRSRSMSAIDTGDEPAEQVATAAALNLFPAALRDEKAFAQQDAIAKLVPLLDETRQILAEQEYAELTQRGSTASSNRVSDLQQKWRIATGPLAGEPSAAALIDLVNHFDQPAWPEQAQKKIHELLANLAAQQRTADMNLYSQNSVARQACGKLISMSRIERARAAIGRVIGQISISTPIYGAFFDSGLTPVVLRKDGDLAWPSNAHATGDQSDISGAVQQLVRQMGDNRLRAILLFTDGRQVGGTLGTISTDSIAPIFPVLSAGTPRDLVLSKTIAPVRAYLDEPVTVEAHIGSANLADIPVDLVLQTGNLTEIQTLRLDRAGAATARLNVPVLRGDEQAIGLQVTPIAGEANDQNNRADIRVAVEPRRMRIALLASFPTRDFQFLRQEVEQSSWIDSTVVLPGQSVPPAQLREQDVIILNDLAVQQLNAAQWTAIQESAEQHGAGLILIAGGNHLPGEYLNNANVSSLLPFDVNSQPVWRTWAGADAYFRFLPIDSDSPVLQLQDDASDVMHQWDRLPAMYHYLQMPELRPEAQRLLVERESGSPVLTQMSLGKGRVMFVGFDETWRWRSLSVAMQQRFWMQLFRHAAGRDQTQEQTQPAELADLSPQTSLLSRLAAERVYSLAESPEIWGKIRQYEKVHPQVTEYALWRSPWLFALILGCFGTEWALRKRFGLA